MLAGPPNAEMRNRRRPSAGNGTHVRATRRYNTHRYTAAHTLSHPRWHAARALLPYWPQADTGYRSCAVLRAYSGGGASDTLAGTHKDSLHTRLVHFEGTNFTVTAASPTTTPLPPPKTANEKLVQIALMERRRANGVIARAIGERSPCAAARSRHGRCACAPRRAPTPAPCSEPAQRNRRNRRSSMQ